MDTLDERVARARGWSKTGDDGFGGGSEWDGWEGIFSGRSGLTERFICDYTPSTDAGQAMGLAEILVAKGYPYLVAIHLTAVGATATVNDGDGEWECGAPTWQEALCEAYIRAMGEAE